MPEPDRRVSPGCAVHAENAEKSTPSGVLITELRDELQQRNIQVPFRGIRDFDTKLMAEDLRWLEQLFVKKKLYSLPLFQRGTEGGGKLLICNPLNPFLKKGGG